MEPLPPEDEHQRRHSHREALADYLRAHPGEWLAATLLERYGGRQAWRTRLSDCRLKMGMHIENRQQRAKMDDGSFFVISEYRYLPYVPLGRDASEFRTQKSLF